MDIGLLNLRRRREKLLCGPAEFSWLNKDSEADVFTELLNKYGILDRSLLIRVLYSYEKASKIINVLQSHAKNSCSNSVPEGRELADRVIFFGTKFGDYVSSQEYVRDVLEIVALSLNITLISTAGFSAFYKQNFRCVNADSTKEIESFLHSVGPATFVNLTGEELSIEIPLQVRVFDVWGSGFPPYSAHASIWWPEMRSYHPLLPAFCHRPQFPSMFAVGAQGAREYPGLDQSRLRKDLTENGEIRLGAFCRTSKLNLSTVELWAEIMRKVERANLYFAFLQSNSESQTLVRSIFEQLGVHGGRIRFLRRMSTQQYLCVLGTMDLNLGAFPEQGGISALDSLMMGVPYIVHEGRSNTYTSTLVLKELELGHWNASDDVSYVQLAISYTNCLNAHSNVSRQRVRDCVLSSELAGPSRTASAWIRFLSGNQSHR